MVTEIKENSTNQANKKSLSDRCGVDDTLTFVGKRWLMTILYEISLDHKQYSSLKKSFRRYTLMNTFEIMQLQLRNVCNFQFKQKKSMDHISDKVKKIGMLRISARKPYPCKITD